MLLLLLHVLELLDLVLELLLHLLHLLDHLLVRVHRGVTRGADAQASQNALGRLRQALRATRQPNISDRGAGAGRGACVAGSGWRGTGTAKHAGQVARAVRSAGCGGTRKVWETRLQGGVRGSRRNIAAFERRAWVVGGEAGMEASGQAGEACRWRAALGWLGLAARRGCDERICDEANRGKSHDPLICYACGSFFW